MRMLWVLMAAMFSLSAMSSAQTTKPAAAADEEALRKVAAHYVERWNRADAKGIAAVFMPDGDYIGSLDGRLVRGPAAIEKYYQEAFAGRFKGAKVTNTVTSIRFLKADVAVFESSFQIAGMRDDSANELPVVKGVATSVNVKHDGRWLITAMRIMIPPAFPRPTSE